MYLNKAGRATFAPLPNDENSASVNRNKMNSGRGGGDENSFSAKPHVKSNGLSIRTGLSSSSSQNTSDPKTPMQALGGASSRRRALGDISNRKSHQASSGTAIDNAVSLNKPNKTVSKSVSFQTPHKSSKINEKSTAGRLLPLTPAFIQQRQIGIRQKSVMFSDSAPSSNKNKLSENTNGVTFDNIQSPHFLVEDIEVPAGRTW